MPFVIQSRGGVENTRLEAKAKDTKKSEAKNSSSEDRHSRGQRQKCSRPRTKDTGASVLIKQKRKTSSKFFFRRSPIEENKKRSSQISRKVSGVFIKNFNNSKSSAVLEPRTGQFSRTWGLETKTKNFDLRGQGLQNVSLTPRASSRTPPLIQTSITDHHKQLDAKLINSNES